MVTKNVQALEYLELLNQKVQEKIKKGRAHGDVSYKSAATEPKPLFSIALPDNMVDLVFHERKSRRTSLPESASTTTKTEKKVSRLASQKAISGDHKDKTSTKRKAHKTLRIIPDTFNNTRGESDHEIKRNLSSSSWQSAPKPSNSRDRIEYFKVARNGHEHLRKRVESKKAMVGINGRPLEEENAVKPESVESSKIPETRIPVSWEDQLLNFPEEVKSVRLKDSGPDPQPKNCCENIQINMQQPTTKLVWRQMVNPFSNSSGRMTKMKWQNPPPAQILPVSPSFIKVSQLKVDQTHRYITNWNLQQSLTVPQIPKMQRISIKPRVERWMSTKNAMDSISPQVCKIKASQYQARSIEKNMNEVQDEGLPKKMLLKKKHKFTILPLTHPKPFPNDPKVINEFFHITKMDTWVQYPPDENKKWKSRKSFENLAVSQNHQDSCHDNGLQCKTEKEHMVNTSVQTEEDGVHSGTVGLNCQEIHGKDNTTNNAPMIHFRIPYCRDWDKCEDGDQWATEDNSLEMIKCNAEPLTGETSPAEQNQKRTEFTINRPKTR